MTDVAEALTALSRSLDQTGAVIEGVRPEQANLPTPCGDWDVARLVNHVVGDLHQFRGLLQGGRYQPSDSDVIGDDWSGAYRAAAADLLAAWSAPGALEGTISLPSGDQPATWRADQLIVEMVIHGWDIARATGQSTDLDRGLAERALAWGAANLKPEYRGSGKSFGAQVPVASDSAPYERLAGFFGRDPGWSPA